MFLTSEHVRQEKKRVQPQISQVDNSISMSNYYEKIDPFGEKLKRLYNCNRMTKDDARYLNY